MFKGKQKPEDFFQNDCIEYIHNKLGQEPWVTVYYQQHSDWESVSIFSALIPNTRVEQSLRYDSWDLHIGDGKPGCMVSYEDDKKKVTYHRYGDDNGVEPLILYRDFYGIKKGYYEISEEFRLFHNLYFDAPNNKYIQIKDNGDEEDVILCGEKQIKIRLKQLKQFLAIKNMHLALLFVIERYSPLTLEELKTEDKIQRVREGNVSYTFSVQEAGFSGKKSLSRLLGKKLIPGMSKERCGIWPFEEEKQYQDFIIGIDENGEPLYHTSNPDVLDNYFGANPGAPHYLTPVFFKREVLTKYYSNPERYSVEDNYLRCTGLWGVRIDNNHDKFVVVFLGDLGRDLPSEEQIYWKSYNVLPDGSISEVNFRRSFLAQWTDPQRADLVFKSTFIQFQKNWEKTFGWPLFKPLADKDQHNFTALRIPLNNDQAEFDQQVLALAKIIIDSINEKEIQKFIPKVEGEKGISKLEKFLGVHGLSGYESYIKFLRALWELRIGSGHRKGDSYKKAITYFQMQEKELKLVFEEILHEATELLKYLENWLIKFR